MDSDLSLDFLSVVEQAAIACAHTMGQGDGHAADQAAVETMRRCLDTVAIDGTIVIGEGERDEAPMLYIGERVGSAVRRARRIAARVDIAVDPLEGTNLCATGAANAMTVLAASDEGGLLHAPDLYMEKLIVGAPAKHVVDLDAPVADNLAAIARSLNRRVDDLVVMVLDRPRHQALIADIRAAGARIRLIPRRRRGRGHCDGRGGIGRARGDGHRRRAGRGADGGGAALPARGDPGAAGDHDARARRALPGDGHHRSAPGLHAPRTWRPASRSSSPRPASPTAR